MKGCISLGMKRSAASVLPTLPIDLIIEILVRMPVRSLMRFKCVSKSWRVLMQSPSFINHHLSQRSYNGRVLFMRRYLLYPDNDDVLSFHDLDSIELTEVWPHLRIPFLERIEDDDGTSRPLYTRSCVDLLGPSKGLVCIAIRNTFILCNPSLREFRHITCPLDSPSGHSVVVLGRGFGCSSVTNHFKVILMRNVFDDSDFEKLPTIMVQLYNSSTNSWRQVDYNYGPSTLPSICTAALLNGVCHWSATTFGGSPKQMILCFDLTKEVFKHLEYPVDFVTYRKGKHLKVLNGCLTMIQHYNDENETYLVEVWVMKEYGVRSSWIKQFAIKSELHLFPLYWKNDGCMIMNAEDIRSYSQLVCVGPHTNEIKKLHVYAYSCTIQGLYYEESLISLNQVIKSS